MTWIVRASVTQIILISVMIIKVSVTNNKGGICNKDNTGIRDTDSMGIHNTDSAGICGIYSMSIHDTDSTVIGDMDSIDICDTIVLISVTWIIRASIIQKHMHCDTCSTSIHDTDSMGICNTDSIGTCDTDSMDIFDTDSMGYSFP